MRKGRSGRKSRAPRSLPPAALERARQASAASPARESVDVIVGVPQTDAGPASSPTPETLETLEALGTNTVDVDPVMTPSDPFPSTAPPAAVAVVSAEAPTAPAKIAPSPIVAAEEDEESIPPIGDIEAEKFFSEGEIAAERSATAIAVDDELDAPASDKAKRKADPAVVARRARFGRYVAWAVGIASVVCLTAIVRSATRDKSATRAAVQTVETSGQPSTLAAPATPETPAVAVAETAPAASGAAAPAASVALESAPSVKEAAPAVSGAAAESAAPAGSAPSAVSAAPAGSGSDDAPKPAADATVDKLAARRALEAGKLANAIEAGERAVSADPSDAESWLILGAAYQEKGNLNDARRCYTSCLKEGKRGPKGECAAMLR